MNSKQFTSRLIDATGGSDNGRILNIRAALSKEDLIPTYKDPMSTTSAAWYLLTYFVCPNSAPEKLQNWIKSKRREWGKMQPKHNPVLALAAALDDLETRTRLHSIMVDRTFGLVVLNINYAGEVQQIEIPTQSIPDNYKELAPIRKRLFVDGAFIRELADAIAEAKTKVHA